MSPENWRYLFGLADLCCKTWREPDQGIWEVRTEPRHFLHSKLNCWLAMRRAVQLAEMAGETPPAHWVDERDALATYLIEAVDACGWCPQAVGFEVPDAAALLVPALGLLAADDPRVTRTVEVITSELSDATGLLLRYRAEDGVRGGEGAFLLCSFWLVDVLTHSGRLDEAGSLLERLLDLANDVGLYAEEVDPATGEHLGNTPQAFTHMALVTSCEYLSAARRGLLPTDGGPHNFAELAVDRLLASGA
jgi:GH15 family glucan-1,4-alpha-glucosidase